MIKLSESRPTKSDIGRKVLFVPDHARNNINHKDCEEGILKSSEGHTAKVIFSTGTKTCNHTNLIWY